MDSGSAQNRQTVTVSSGTLVSYATGNQTIFSPTIGGIVPASGGGTSTTLRADGTWTATFTGTWTFPTLNSTTIGATTGNIVTVNVTTLNGTTVVATTGNITTVNATTVAASSQVTIGASNTPAYDSVTGNIGYYARTTAEVAAAVTPTNFSYPPGYVDRYGTNTIPGTTSMVAAFNAAIAVAQRSGGANGNVVTYGRSAPYFLDSPVNCTTGPGQVPSAKGIIIRGECQFLAITNNSPAYPGILAKHTGHVFDCTGTYGIVFENVTIGTDLSTYPQTGWFLARGTDKNSQHVHFMNCGFIGKASKAVLYNFGSENSLQIGCTFINRATDAGAKTVWLTGSNILGLTSTFQTVGSGGGTPCTVHLFQGGEYHNWGSSATGDVFAFDGCSKITLSDFFVSTGSATSACRSYIYCETLNGVTNNVTIRGLVSEQNSFNPNYGVTFGTTAGTPAAWLLDNNEFTVNTSKLFAPSTIICDGFYLRALISDTGSPNINFAGTLQNSVIDEVETTIVIATSTNNRITAQIGNLAITTRSNDFWTCVGPLTWTPGTGALTHGGTLTVSNVQVQYQGGEVIHNCDLSDTVSISCAQGTALTGLLRAGSTDSALSIVTNRNTGVIIGTAQVSGTSLLLPAISVGAGVVITITARYFCA